MTVKEITRLFNSERFDVTRATVKVCLPDGTRLDIDRVNYDPDTNEAELTVRAEEPQAAE